MGPFWGRFWDHFGDLFLSEAAKADFLENVLPPAWEHEFLGPQGSKIVQKSVENVTENSFRRQVRLERLSGTIWEHFGLHFGTPKRPKGPNSDPKMTFKRPRGPKKVNRENDGISMNSART